MSGRIAGVLLTGCFALGAACGVGFSTTPIAYTPQPDRIANPPVTLRSLILANTVQGCVADPIYSQAMLIVKFVCNSGAGNNVLRFDRIASLEIQQSGPWYRVLVHHSGGSEDFEWDSKSLDDAQHIADAIVAITRRAKAEPEAADPAGKLM